MNNGWIKLYRKSKDNPLMRDANAWMIFCWILLTVDRTTGEMTLGRIWASEYFGMKQTTFRDALYRLRDKYKVAATTSDNKKTTIRVLNWAKYQDKEEMTPALTPTRRQPDANQTPHIQEVENKELRRETLSSMKYLLELPSNDLAEFTIAFICTDRQIINKAQSLYDYCSSKGRAYKDYKALLRNALRKDFGDRISPTQFTSTLPDLTPEEQALADKKLQEIRNQWKTKKSIN